jgi:methylglutaconyl-CoA hydratase
VPEIPVKIEWKASGVVHIVLNRPDKANCYNQAMLMELAQALAVLDDDASVRVLVLRGTGRHFCGGADLEYLRSAKGALAATAQAPANLDDVLSKLDRLTKPTVAVVHGACLGGGLGLIACCDAVLARDDAYFCVPELRLGFAPAALMPYLVRTYGQRQLRRYGLSGDRISAQHAFQIGLVHHVCSREVLDQEADQVVDSMLRCAPLALARFKSAIVDGLSDAAVLPPDPEELAEGLASMREKRHPRWYGPRPK